MIQDLEDKAYKFSIEALGYFKALNKISPSEDCYSSLSQKAGMVSKCMIDLSSAESNEDFSTCLKRAKDTLNKFTKEFKDVDIPEELAEVNTRVIKKALEVEAVLDNVIEKLIY